jgi:general secretion pathway protein D
LAWTLAFCLGAAEVHAQRATTGIRPGGVQRNTAGTRIGGGGLGGAAGARQYYAPGTVGEAMVTADPETRRLIVITDEETSEYVSQVITNLDQPKPQVLIKVIFLEVTHRKTLDIGIEGGSTHQYNDTTRGAGAQVFGISGLNSVATNVPLNALGLPLQSFVPTPPGAGVYQIMGSDFQATLRAIAQAGKTEVLSRPSVLARNNQQAVITVGQEVPFITNTRFDTGGNQINTVQYQDIGIILRVTPFITSDGMVEMIVSPEISNLTDQTVPVQAGVDAPVIAKRSADTVVVTPNGQTVIIGGLMEDRRLESISKIPVLGDLPLLGVLFRRKITGNEKTELIIFLTPHIVKEPAQLAAVSANERNAAVMMPKAFSEEELDRFLDGLPKKENSTKENSTKKNSTKNKKSK